MVAFFILKVLTKVFIECIVGGVVGDTQRGIVACRIASVSGLATVVPTSVSVFVFSISIICQYLFKTFKVKSYGKL